MLVIISNLSLAQTKFQFDFSTLKSDVISIDNRDFLLLSDKTLPYTSEISGQPQIPCYNKIIYLNLDSKINIHYTVTNITIETLATNLKLFPKQPDLMKNKTKQDFVFDEQYYTLGIGNDTSAVRIKELGIKKDKRLVLIQVFPAAYLPVENILLRYGTVNVDIEITNSHNNMDKSIATTTRERKMIIVSPEMFRETLQPFIKWKTQEGIRITEIYPSDISGAWNTTNIKQHLQTLWNNQTLQEPFADFLLLCGDNEQLPAFSIAAGSYGASTDAHITDLYYADYTADAIADVFYGRFSAQNTSQMQAIIDKTINYEKFELNDTSYLNNILLVAGKETSGNAQTQGNGQINYAKSYLTELDTLLYYNPASANNTNAIIQRLNAGNSFVNYTAHCSNSGWANPNITNSIINSLDANGKLGFYINNCCISGKFDDNQCFAETLLRVSNKGAIGVISASNNTFWDGDYIFSVGNKSETLFPVYDSFSLGMYDRMFHTHNETRDNYAMTQAEIMQAGNLAITLAQKDYALYYREIYHLFGDPSLIPYFGLPAKQEINLPNLLPLEISSITLNALPYSYIALSIGDSLLTASLTDSTGNVTLNFNPIHQSCYLRIVVTKQFMRPFIDSILIQNINSPYISISNIQFTNEQQEPVSKFLSNNIYSISFNLINYGQQTANNTKVSLLQNQGFSIVSSEYLAGNIANLQTVVANNVLSFHLNDAIENNHIIELPIKIIATDFETEYTLKIRVAAPKFEITNLILNLYANDPYIAFDVLNDGETENNTGSVSIQKINTDVATLTETNIKSLSVLNPNQTQHFSYSIALSDNLNNNSILSFTIKVEAMPYCIIKNFEDILLQRNVEDFETGDFSCYSWQHANTSWIIDTTTKHNGLFSTRSGSISHNGTSTLLLDYESICTDSISFFIQTSTELNYDKFHFYIDGIEKLYLSGENSWKYYAFPVSEGKHIYKWEYVKDYSISEGLDAVWIDDVKLPLTRKIVGLNETTMSTKAIKIFPNPASDRLNITNLSNKSTITILNMNGKILYKREIFGQNNALIDLDMFSSGYYMICIHTDESLTTQKFVIIK